MSRNRSVPKVHQNARFWRLFGTLWWLPSAHRQCFIVCPVPSTGQVNSIHAVQRPFQCHLTSALTALHEGSQLDSLDCGQPECNATSFFWRAHGLIDPLESLPPGHWATARQLRMNIGDGQTATAAIRTSFPPGRRISIAILVPLWERSTSVQDKIALPAPVWSQARRPTSFRSSRRIWKDTVAPVF